MLYLRLKKRKTFFEKMFENILQIIKQNRRGTLLRLKKNSGRSRTVPEKKTKKGDPFVSSGFVGYLKKVKNERGRNHLHNICIGRTWHLAFVVSGVSLKSGPITVSLKKKVSVIVVFLVGALSF